MFRRPLQRLAALLLTVTLGACVTSIGEPFAPELKKSYVLTEDLVLTSQELSLPGLFQGSQEVPSVMTREEYRQLKSLNLTEYFPLPDLGEVAQGNRVRVEQMFTYSDINARVRYGKLQLTNPATGEQLVAHGVWKYVGPKLRELK